MKKSINILIMMLVLTAVVVFAQGQSDSYKNIYNIQSESLKKEELNRITSLDYDVLSLYKIQGAYISIESFSKKEKMVGLKKEIIKAKVETKLRLAGIKILSFEEFKKAPNTPMLNIDLGLIDVFESDSPIKLYTYSLLIRYLQKVTVKRQELQYEIVAETWSMRMLGVRPPELINNSIYSDIENLTDLFINDYLKANPKEEK